VSLVFLVLREVMVVQEPLDLKVRRVRKETLVRPDLLDHQAMTENTVLEDRPDQRVRRVSPGSKEDLDPEVHQVWRDPRVTLEHLASLVILENRGLVASRESLAILVITAGRVTEVFKETLVLRVNLVYKDLLENRECLVHLVNKAMLDPQELRETSDPLDLQDFREHLVIKDLQVLKDHQV